jgi:hypothetical protein
MRDVSRDARLHCDPQPPACACAQTYVRDHLISARRNFVHIFLLCSLVRSLSTHSTCFHLDAVLYSFSLHVLTWSFNHNSCNAISSRRCALFIVIARAHVLVQSQLLQCDLAQGMTTRSFKETQVPSFTLLGLSTSSLGSTTLRISGD